MINEKKKKEKKPSYNGQFWCTVSIGDIFYSVFYVRRSSHENPAEPSKPIIDPCRVNFQNITKTKNKGQYVVFFFSENSKAVLSIASSDLRAQLSSL